MPSGLLPFVNREDIAERAQEQVRQEVVQKLSRWAVENERSQRHLRVLLGLVPGRITPTAGSRHAPTPHPVNRLP